MKRIITLVFLSLFAMTAVIGCGNGDTNQKDNNKEHSHEEEGPGEDACEHLKESENAITTAANISSIFTDNATKIEGHKHYEVTVNGASTPKIGYLHFELKDEGDVNIAVGKKVTLKLVKQGEETTEISPNETLDDQSTKCDKAPRIAIFKTLSSGSYALKIESREANPIPLVLLAGEEEEHHH